MPRIDPIRGGFIGGIRTKYRSSFPSKISKLPTYEQNSASESEDDNQPPPYSRDNYYQQQRRRPSHYGNVKLILET
jgi:hypothetical protein